MKVQVIIHQEEDGGYWAEVPALPGCYTQGDTLDELRANLRDAVEAILMGPEAPEPPAEGRLEEVEI
jgi:predicted RNase H-like HicB family nuclease